MSIGGGPPRVRVSQVGRKGGKLVGSVRIYLQPDKHSDRQLVACRHSSYALRDLRKPSV